MTKEEIEQLLKSAHGDEPCHICGKKRWEYGSGFCSYPHAMVPKKPVDDLHPEGFWTWEQIPNE